METYMVLAVGSGAAQQQDLGALSVTVLTGQVESCVSCLEKKIKAIGRSQSLSLLVRSSTLL